MNDGEKIRNAVSSWDVFERIVSFYGTALKSFFLRRVRRREDAEDLVQEVRVRASVGLARFRGRCRIRCWLFCIAHNVWVDYHRKNGNGKTERLSGAPDAAGEAAEMLQTHPDAVRMSCDVCLRLDRCRCCIRRTLPLDQQVAVLACDVWGCSCREAARLMKVNPVPFKHRLQGARVALDRASGEVCALVRKTGAPTRCGFSENAADNSDGRESSPSASRQSGDQHRLLLLRDRLLRLLDGRL